MDTLVFIVSNVASAVIGIVVGLLCEKQLEAAWSRIRRYVGVKFRARAVEPPTPETFSLGRRAFSFLVIDGDGEGAYTRDTITTMVMSDSVALPSEVEKLKTSIAEREATKKAQGLPAAWNGPQYSLVRYAISRTIPDEHLAVSLTFAPSDYYSFQATVVSLDANLLAPPAVLNLRQKYLVGQELSRPIPFLAQGFGVALVAISSDDKLILGWRSADSGARPGELDVTVVEGVHPVLDRADDSPAPDLYKTAVRGAWEEAGFEIQRNQVTFLGLGLDTEYYQWNLLGLMRLDYAGTVALERRRRGTGGKWETRRFDVLSAEPTAAFRFLSGQRMWSVGWVAVYWALVHIYGRRQVDEAAETIYGRRVRPQVG